MDYIQRAFTQWQAIHPERDIDTILTTGRVLRIASFLQAASEDAVGRFGLSRGEYDMLSAIRRSGKNCRATELSVLTKSSGAAITKRLDRLSKAGYLTRKVLPRDRRVVLVELTDEGRALVDEMLPVVTGAESVYLDGFTSNELETFKELLSKLLVNVDPEEY